MSKFAHISDVHLGGWKQKPLQELNFLSFRKAIDMCIKKKVDFVIISGDLFDSAYPPIEILKETFGEFKRLKEERIPSFVIAGSHDYSVSGKTFLDVLERAGFCRNVADFEENKGNIILNPTVYGNFAIYGYPGKKSGLEVADLRRIKLNDSPGMFKILMLHTTIDKAKGNIPVDFIETESLPKADYYALGHLHIDFQYQNFVYPGPIFPNNFQELEELDSGSFYIFDAKSNSLEKVKLDIKSTVSINIKIDNTLSATEKIISEIKKRDIRDKILLLRITGKLEHGRISDIKFSQIDEIVKTNGAYFMLKNTHDLKTMEIDLEVELDDVENLEESLIKSYSGQNASEFNKLIIPLINALSLEKQEDERLEVFDNRLIDGVKKTFGF